MQLTFGGGASEVGASFLLLNIDGKNIVLDCGIRMNGDNSMPDLSFLKKSDTVDIILLSHAHMDHSGALPVLSREYPNAKIYMTHATKDLIRVLLYDSLKIMEHKETEIPIFAEIHVEAMLNNIVCFSPAHTFRPFNDSKGNNIEITFYSAGHIAGAVGIFINGSEGSFFYSGDFSVTPQLTVEGASFPKLRADTAVIESTYGDRLHASRDIEEERLLETIMKVTGRKGKMLIPAFSLGRAQEIILLINKAINKKLLPENIQIYVDGMVNDICQVFSRNPNYLKTQYGKKILKGADIFYNDNVIAVNKDKKVREEIINNSDGLVIISSSGMLTGGPSQWYAERLAGDENNYIALTGYQDEESPGKQLLTMLDAEEDERILKFGDKTIPVRCEAGMYGLSAHADKMEIINLAHTLAARKIFLNHGNEEVVNNLGAELQREYTFGRVYVPKNGETFDISVKNKRKQLDKSAYGINKYMTAADNLADSNLWRFILDNYSAAKAFTIEDLYLVRFGSSPDNEQNFNNFRDMINGSSYFEPEKKRPFMFHAVSEEDAAENSSDKYMEVNQMLALAAEYFPQESGLYKKGARVETKIAVLSFNFPAVAAEKYSCKIAEFERATNWGTEINSEYNLNAAEQLIISLLSAGRNSVKKFSHQKPTNTIQVSLKTIPPNIENIKNQFHETTGISLKFTESNNVGQLKITPDTKSKMEQNQTFQLIDSVFSSTPHKLYKKGIKVKDGKQGIELTFISPFIARLYNSEIEELQNKTNWNIWSSAETNLHEVTKMVGDLLDKNLIAYKKLSYKADKIHVVFDSAQSIDKSKKTCITQEFLKLTGIDLVI